MTLKKPHLHPTTPGSVGEMFRELRQRARLTQEQLATKAFVDPSGISMIESGKRNPSRTMVLDCAEALKLTPVERDLLLITGGHAPQVLMEKPALVLHRMIAYWHTQAEEDEAA